jgi:hypothetical protein
VDFLLVAHFREETLELDCVGDSIADPRLAAWDVALTMTTQALHVRGKSFARASLYARFKELIETDDLDLTNSGDERRYGFDSALEAGSTVDMTIDLACGYRND